ncbi:glycoside hydrolase family 2 protein [Arcticibacter sp.]|jgi:beta-galactosidase/beta-glucuronidase|uniref:glycoside hydrolase family 2 protein n=1 Tax=Arcticibacter sp. TaxID=1872630 RepID=UPI00388F7F16
MKKILIAFITLLNFSGDLLAQENTTRQMLTPWSGKLDKEKPLNNYPRPSLVRAGWENLNGRWDYAITRQSNGIPNRWHGEIIVPFPVESYLSDVKKSVGKDSLLWYKRTFTVDRENSGKKILLHFGASDWRTEVYINNRKVGRHEGGYTEFTFDISPYLKGGKEELMVSVWDPTDDGRQARGKQVKKPGGIYYTPVTGIWQTVWLEIVPETYVESYRIKTDIDQSIVTINPVVLNAQNRDSLMLTILDGAKEILNRKFTANMEMTFNLPGAKLWSPDAPNLYNFQLRVLRNEKTLDRIDGYFGMRKIEVTKDEKGVDRLFLNNKAVFQYGPLDQGYWPDGIYTAPTEEALVSDIMMMKESGFNMVRKHVKVEPARWYYHCDKLGLIVWQDMPSGYGEIVPVKDHDQSVNGSWLDKNYKDVDRDSISELSFRKEWSSIISQLYNHPSICVWVPFNESWGQFKTNEILKWTKTLDPTRIVDGPSGWIDRGEGETRDYHLYGDRLKGIPLEKDRALVIGEFGGLGYAVPNHIYSSNAWSYKGFKNSKELGIAYKKLIDKIEILKNQGFSGAVYTQLTDVETEINGLITYDRQKIKIPVSNLKKLHNRLIRKDK